MNNAVRWIIFTPLAAIFTVGLFLLMQFLISAEFKPQEKTDVGTFEINPQVEKIEVIEREIEVAELQRVETPPPPPQIERAQAETPTEKIASLEGSIPEFEPPTINKQSFKITVSDRDAQPLVRLQPNIPPRFLSGDNSGYCKMTFDVSPEGQPFNIQANVCTTSIIKSSSIKTVQRWKYNPKIVDGRPVGRTGVETTIKYNLDDGRGNILPVPKGF